MSFEKRLDELGETVQFAEEIFELSYEKDEKTNYIIYSATVHVYRGFCVSY
ncbi:hypothetical protein OCD85_16005 [Bacillus pacificus]|uniref:hypothetical protein n=1 Tax=Bacillus cereus group TaxID=86661 RepID=UPI0007A7D671|nr:MULTISPECIES: hypothetical protein [Bacillus cereus group]KYP99916.1 hypothetical protein B4079_4926 [Bacillus cereus]MCC2352820.1 hypothetical protein [Bacillus pacificus]MCC2469359.1 hypothetical protein [Bacillus pacificus]MCU5248296.1 hypothetical protein [Bacillus pacificus]MCU5362480.1 hypothetical protein [Bacillus pacificus]